MNNDHWNKLTIRLGCTVKDSARLRQRAFNNVSPTATDQSIQQFAKLISQLTDEPVKTITLAGNRTIAIQ